MKVNTSPIVRVNEFATRSAHEDWVVVDARLLAQKAKDAGENPRGREIHSFHRADGDLLHRMLNCLQPESYIRPHRHSNPPKDEMICVLQGSVGYVVFDDQGNTGEDRFALLDPTRGFYGADWRAGVWHTFFALEGDTVVVEVKSGPYVPAGDKDFASWAPPEGAPQAEAWHKELEDRFRCFWGLPGRNWGQVNPP